MLNKINRQKLFICEILHGNGEVVMFEKDVVKDGYRETFVGHEKEMSEMIDTAFSLLYNSQAKGINVEKLESAVRTIYKDVFKKNDESYWFNTIYKEYKYHFRPKSDLLKIEKYIHGKRVLDFGSGAGYLAIELKNRGYDVLATDVLDYRVKEAQSITFKQMSSPVSIPYGNDAADTAIVKTVLHHIDDTSIAMVMNELRRVSHRLIIEEDTYNPAPTIKNFQDIYKSQQRMQQFLGMSLENQFRAMMLSCFFSNAVAHGTSNINFAFDFRTIDEWIETIESHGFKTTDVILTGFEQGKLSKSCQAWMVFDKR